MTEVDGLYIDGEFVEPATGDWFDSVDPYTNEAWIEIPRGGPEDVDRAVRAAHRAAFDSEWNELTPTERGEWLFTLADELEARADDHALRDVRDNGKPIREMRPQHESIPDWLRFYGGLADKVHGDNIEPNKSDKHVFTRKEPLGVVGAITPWNSPLMLSMWKIAPALAAGNAVVLKPDEHTSASSLGFAAAVDAVGFPAGTINVVTGFGDEVGQPLVEHETVQKISFTGGSETGSLIASEASKHLKQTTMELGGKSPYVVFPDAKLEQAVDAALTGMFSAGGQTCSAASRVLVHGAIYDEFVDRYVRGAAQISMGDPTDPATEMGPLANETQFEKVTEYVRIGQEEGATLECGGRPPEQGDDEWFFPPTVLSDVDNDSRLAQEEIFGPVAAIVEFSSEAEAIRLANDVEYGLAGAVWTEDMRRAHRVANAIRAGRIWVNTYRTSGVTTPQGGYKKSGWGRENGVEAIEEYLETKAVWVELDEDPSYRFEVE